jgi:uracil-DNA glycosylase
MSKAQSTDIQFDAHCIRCPRIADFLVTVRETHPDYHAGPVPPFGIKKPELLVVGLGPGMHGANATGRPFTGDYAGILLYKTLHDYGYANQAEATSRDDGLKLINCRITNAVKCLPPGNKPLGTEITNCNSYLEAELKVLKDRLIILALGGVAHKAILKALSIKQSQFPFGHNQIHQIAEHRYLVDSYHCSRYNTSTKRLTEPMFRDVFDSIKTIANEAV